MMFRNTLDHHYILAQQRRKRKYNLWLMKSTIKMFLVMAGMVGVAMLTSLLAGLIT